MSHVTAITTVLDRCRARTIPCYRSPAKFARIRRAVACATSAVVLSTLSLWCVAAELRIAAPNAVRGPLSEIALAYQGVSGIRTVITWAGSEAISQRVANGEVFDVVVNTSQGLDVLARQGKVDAKSKTDFARSGIGIAIRPGRPVPDVSTPEALRRTLLESASIAISSGASGRYLEGMFRQLGVLEQLRPHIKQPPSGTQIGDMLARGDADLGFQQVAELIHAEGIVYLGPLPTVLQNYTVWSAAVHAAVADPEAARAFLTRLVAPEYLPTVLKSGMEPP